MQKYTKNKIKSGLEIMGLDQDKEDLWIGGIKGVNCGVYSMLLIGSGLERVIAKGLDQDKKDIWIGGIKGVNCGVYSMLLIGSGLEGVIAKGLDQDKEDLWIIRS